MRTIYYGGDILTMELPLYVEAVLTENGKIKKVGTKKEILSQKQEGDKVISLEGKTMLPAFIDGHSHITSMAQTLGLVNLEGTISFEQIREKIEKYLSVKKPKKGEWVMGFGYDHNFLQEKKHPNKFFLDSITEEFPVLIMHKSGHMGVLNSYALSKVGINSETENPEGGLIKRMENSTEPDGYLEEKAMMIASDKVDRPGREEIICQLKMAQNIYFENGITTIQEGLTKQNEWNLLKYIADSKEIMADIVSYVDIREKEEWFFENSEYHQVYHNHLKIGGYKLFLDGSPQGRTAWMSKPYLGKEENYCGYPIYSDEEVQRFIRKAIKEEQQIIIHCNGDAAAQQMIDSYEKIQKEEGQKDLRPVMIHAQLVREDQLKRMARLGMMASFFIAHTYYWGDIHLQNFGEERAKRISPAKTASKYGVPYTFHQDSPVLLPNMIETIWCAANRISREGKDMGHAERISTLDALKAITSIAAYQYREEDRKGSIKEGKLADFVILDKNPLEVEKEGLKDIQILATIKEDRMVYRAEEF